jgi:hypothetical protein
LTVPTVFFDEAGKGSVRTESTSIMNLISDPKR